MQLVLGDPGTALDGVCKAQQQICQPHASSQGCGNDAVRAVPRMLCRLTQLNLLWSGKGVRALHREHFTQLRSRTARTRCTRDLCVHALPCLQNIPVADAKPDDIKDLLGGALFQALYKWMKVQASELLSS